LSTRAAGEPGSETRAWIERSFAALLDDAEIDAVYLPLPNNLHAPWTIRAVERGKHVLCEKPLALSAAECREMERAAAANGVKLMETFMYRFHPRTEKAVELVRLGALMDVGCYCVNVSRTLAGAEPVEVQAWATWGANGVDQQLSGADEYRLMVEHFADCVLHDRALRYSALEAAANMAVIEALYRSARSGGQPVAVEPGSRAR
jgi:predicted dehydrogenase